MYAIYDSKPYHIMKPKTWCVVIGYKNKSTTKEIRVESISEADARLMVKQFLNTDQFLKSIEQVGPLI